MVQMATKPSMKEGVEEGPAVHRIRITLTSKNVKNLEKGERATCRRRRRDFHALLLLEQSAPT